MNEEENKREEAEINVEEAWPDPPAGGGFCPLSENVFWETDEE